MNLNRLHGCHNWPEPFPFYEVQNGWTEDGRRIMELIPATGSKECRYDYKATDSQCNGCKWRD